LFVTADNGASCDDSHFQSLPKFARQDAKAKVLLTIGDDGDTYVNNNVVEDDYYWSVRLR